MVDLEGVEVKRKHWSKSSDLIAHSQYLNSHVSLSYIFWSDCRVRGDRAETCNSKLEKLFAEENEMTVYMQSCVKTDLETGFILPTSCKLQEETGG